MSLMEDGRKKKVEAGREKFVAYQKKKQNIDKSLGCRNELENEIESDYSQDSTNASTFTNPEHQEDLGDSPSIHSPNSKSSAIKHLYKQIKALQNELKDKDLLIDSLQVELESIRNLSHFDASTGPIPNSENFEQKIAELQHSLRTRDAYIEKLSEDLQHRSQVCDAAVQQERQRLEEINNLHQKLKDAFEVIENKFGVSFTDQQEQIYDLQSKVSQMNINVQDNTALVNDLRQALERKDNDLKRKEKELQEKVAHLKNYKETTAKEIHGLMGDVEKLHQMIVSKENELINTKEDMENMQLQLEAQFKEQINQLKQEFWKKQEEEKKRLNQIHDDVLHKCLKNHEMELARQNMNMSTEFTTYKLSCEAQFSSYRECMESLIQKIDEDNKRLEEDYEKQIANCNKELDMCRQQIDNYERKLSEEVQKVEQKCRCAYESELFKYKCSFENKSSSAEEEIEKLTKNLKDLVSSEAKKEVELETYKYELKKSKGEVNELLDKLNIKVEDIRKYEENLKVNKEEIVELSDKLKQAELKEMELLKELQKYQTVVKEYEEKITAFNVSLKEDLEHVEMKHLNVLKEYEKEIEKLKCALDDKTKMHESELLYYAKELLKQKDLTSTAEVSNDSEQVNKEEISSLKAAVEYSNKLVKNYDKKLNEIRKSYLDDLTLYENEITNLKENLNKVSNTKQNLLQQLLNHKKDFKDLKNKLCSLIYNCQTSVSANDIHSSSFEMVDDDNKNLEKLKYELDLSKSELYEFIDCLKTSLKDIEQDQSAHLQNLSCENNELREQLSILQSAHSLLTENKLIYENKPGYVVASCQTDSLKKKLNESGEDVYVQNLELSKQNSELTKLNNQLTADKDMLQKEAKKLLSDKNCLEEERKKCFCTDSLTQEITKAVETEMKEQDIDIENIPHKRIFKGIATSTPIYVTQPLLNNNDTTSTPKRHKFNLEKLEGQLTAIHWVEECSRLENENYSLETQIEGMQTNMKEMEHCLIVARNEITLFEIKCKKLGERLDEMEKYKRLANSWEQQNIQYKMRNEHLEKDRDVLKIDLKVLTEQNLYLERKNNENILKFCKHIPNQSDLDFEDIILELKEKSDEVILLKDKIFVDQQNHLSLKDRIEEMVCSLNNAIYNFDETKKELENARMELEEAYKDREQIVLEKRLLEKELFVLTSKVKYMDLGKEKHSIKSSLEICEFMKAFQEDLVELKRQNVQEKALIERFTLEKSTADSREIGPLTKEELNLLIQSNILLTKEKEKLMQCVQEQQHLLSTIRNENGLTEDYWMNMCDIQTKLITELRDHLDQHRKIVEVLKSVEKFNNDLSLLRDQLSEKIQEKATLEEQLQEENTSMKVIEKQVAEMEDQLKRKNDYIQLLKQEKDSLNNQLITTEENLFISENKNTVLERTLRDREIRLKHGQLELRASQLDRSGHNLSLEPVTQTARLVDVRSELEQHNTALQAQLQRLYNIQSQQTSLQFSQKLAAMEQQYQDQVSTLQKMLKEKSAEVNNLLSNRFLSSLDLPTDVADSRFQDLIDFKENHRAKLEDIKQSLDDKGLHLYFILRDKFQLYAQHQVMFAIAKFKNEHELLSESETNTLILKHQQELQLLKANMEVEKEKEINSFIQDLEKQYCEEIAALNQLLHIQNQKLNMTRCTESEVALNQLLTCLSNDYTQSVKILQNSWKENYKQCLETICDNLNKNLGVKTCSISLDLNTNLTDNEKLDKVEELLRQEEMVVSKAQELQNKIHEQYTTALEEFKQALEEAHHRVVNTIPILKKQLEEGHIISEQENEIEKLKSAKENLETEHKSAINLLLKDHESELSSVRTLLSQLQQSTVNNGGGDMTVVSTLRAELEMKHAQEMEKLRTYFEQKCADLEKHYSEEIYSQQSRKVSGDSSCSESEAGIDIYYMGGSGDLNRRTPQHDEHNGEMHEECEKRLAKVKKELEEMRLDLEAKYESDIEALKSDYAVRFEEYIQNNMSSNQNAESQTFDMKYGVLCGQTEENLESDMEKAMTDWERRLEIEKIKFEQEKEIEIAELRRELEEKYSRKLEELHKKFLSMSQDQDFELKVAQIRSEVKEDYESEIHKIRDEIETIERLRKEEEIENLKKELNRQHMKELEKVKIAYEEMVKKEVENSLLKIRKEANFSQEYEEKVQFIKEQVKADYEKELEKIRRNVESIEIQRKDEEIQHLKDALKKIHTKEIENLNKNYESQMKNEIECLKKQFKVEIENLEAKHKDEIKVMEEMLENSAQDQLMQNNDFETVGEMFENKMQEQVEQIFNLTKELGEIEERHKSKVIEINKDWECKFNEKCIIHNNEVKLLKDAYEQKLLEERKNYVELESLHFQAISKIEEQEMQKLDEHAWTLQEQEEEVQRRVEEARTEILHSLEQQIKALVASSDEGEDKSEWPPELATLEQQFTSKYQCQLAQLIEKHALEIADIHADYEERFSSLIKEYSLKQAENMPQLAIATGDEELDKIITERDNLRKIAIALRHIVGQLANYLINCEEELNNTLVGELLRLEIDESKMLCNNSSKITVLSDNSSEEENEPSLDKSLIGSRQKRVHFAPDVTNIITLLEEDSLLEYFDKNRDISMDFGNKLGSCLERLKVESAALLGLTTLKNKNVPEFEGRRLSSITRQLIEEKKSKDELNNKLQESQEILAKYEQELSDLRTELNEIIERHAKEKAVAASTETVYAASPVQARIQKITQLQDKARGLLAEKGECPPQWLQLIDELCREGDSLADEARRDREDLQLQVEAADKQLRSTRAFLEDQAAERELERDEFNKEVGRLQELLREKERDWTTKERFATEVETLEQQIRETTELLKVTQEKKDELETELKAAVDKIWVLRDIISEQEVQVSNKSEREATLEQRLDELETELDKQNRAQQKMLQELEELRESGGDAALLEQIHILQDQLKKQTNSSLVRQMKSQLREMSKSIDKRIKELESLNIHASAASLSSPSEDISIREQLDSWNRCDTPEDRVLYAGSPPAPLPSEEVNKLQEKLIKLSRVEETVMKKLKDQQIQLSTVRSHIEDVQAERDVLQQQCDKQLEKVASLTSRLDEMRIRTDREQTAVNVQLQDKIRNLENQKKILSDKITDLKQEVTNLKQHLNCAQELVSSQDEKLRAILTPKEELINNLQQEIAVMHEEKQKLKKVVEKYRSAQNVSLPSLIEMLLAEKNADIDRLQEKVAEFQSYSAAEHSGSGHLNSKGHRVSFASDVTNMHLNEEERLRSAAPDISLQPNFTSLSMGDMVKNELSLRDLQKNLSSIAEPQMENKLYPAPTDRIAELEAELLKVRCELTEKAERLTECEAQLPLMEEELQKTKEELLSTVTAVTEDKKYYQEHLEKLTNTQTKLNEKENEVEKLKDTLARKEEDIVKTTADVRALQMISENLQKKLQEAKQFVENESTELAQKEIEQLKKEKLAISEQHEQLKSNLEKVGIDVYKLKKNLDSEKKSNSKLKEILINTEKEKDLIGNELKKTENEKLLIIKELQLIKSNCEIHQSELESSLIRIKEQELIISDLKKEIEYITANSNKYLIECTNLKNELENLSQHHSNELLNLSKKRANEVAQLKEEVEELQRMNKNLKENCNLLDNKLKQKIFVEALLNNNEDKIKQLEFDIKQLQDSNSCLKEEKRLAEERFGLEISELKMLMNDLNVNVISLEKSEQEYQLALNKEKELQNIITRKYETLKIEYDRQRRARKEMEKKCHVQRQELEKEKKYVALLEEQISGKGKKSVSNLRITETNVFEIKPDAQYTDVDDLATKLHRELNLSLQLDKNISTYQETDLRTQPIVDHLKRKLAQVEADKFVEKMTLNELRAKVEEDTRRYENELQHAHELHNEMMKYKSLLAEMELKNETLRKAIELEKRRYAYMEKMKNATADMLTEREVGMKLVEEEKQKYNSLRDMCQQLEAMAIETENEIRNLENSVEYKKAMAKKRELDGYEGRLEAEQKAAADLWREVEAEKQLNRHLTEQLKIHEEFTNDKRQALQVILDDKKRLQAIIDELMVKLDRLTYEKQMARKKLEMARRKHTDLTKDSLEQSPTNTLEKENAMLKLQLKQAELQLQALASDTPLKLKLKEANSALQKLVAEREQLQSHLSYLEEQKEILNRTLSNIRQENDDLRQQLKGGPKILVTDGHMEDVNAKYASERAAWLKEKEMLQKALAQASRPHSLSDFDSDLHHILKRYLRAESYRKSLAWQKQYLLVAIAGYKEEESSTIKKLKECVGHTVKEPSVRINKFKVAALVIVCISRMINIVEHRRGSRQSTYDILYKALSKSKKLPYKCHPDTETNLWERPGESPLARWPLLVPSTPGCVSEYLERFNEMQNRIRRTLASNNT